MPRAIGFPMPRHLDGNLSEEGILVKSEERRVKKQRSAAERESQFNSFTEVSHVVQVRAEGPKAPSPGHRPGYNGNQQGAL